MKKCLWLFWINLFIGAFTFGGGYIVVPMINKYFVWKKRLFSKEELLSMAAIAQSTPGAIAVNLSALAGHRTAGMAGVICSCLGAIIPPLVILSIITVWYDAFSSNPAVEAVLRGMQAGVAALIVDIVVDMWQMILRRKSALLNALVPGAFRKSAPANQGSSPTFPGVPSTSTGATSIKGVPLLPIKNKGSSFSSASSRAPE